MKTKLFEIRDAATFIPAMATWLASENEEQRYLLRRVGLDANGAYRVLLTKLSSGESKYDCHNWSASARTMHVAHHWIETNWEQLNDGDVVDVEFILGETAAPKQSERVTAPL